MISFQILLEMIFHGFVASVFESVLKCIKHKHICILYNDFLFVVDILC